MLNERGWNFAWLMSRARLEVLYLASFEKLEHGVGENEKRPV